MNLQWMCVLAFYYLFYSESWARKKKNKSAWWIFTQLYFPNGESLLNCFEKKKWIDGGSWPNDLDENVIRGEDLRRVGSRCRLRLHKTAQNKPCYIKGCFTIRVHFQKLHSSPVLTVEAYFDFKVLLPKHWSGLGLPTAIKRGLESINFSKKYAHS